MASSERVGEIFSDGGGGSGNGVGPWGSLGAGEQKVGRGVSWRDVTSRLIIWCWAEHTYCRLYRSYADNYQAKLPFSAVKLIRNCSYKPRIAKEHTVPVLSRGTLALLFSSW